MCWHVHKLVYEAQSPIHIGFHDIGMIQRTRCYIPGKLLWGAATAKLTRTIYRNCNSQNYVKTGEFLKKNIIFTYLFPSFDGINAYIPHYKNGYESGHCETISEDEFEYRIIGSYGSTAMEPFSGTAEEGSLHETELILSSPRSSYRPLKFIGYMLCRSQIEAVNDFIAVATANDLKLLGGNGPIHLIEHILNCIQVGGGRQYGYGSLLIQNQDVHFDDFNLWDRFPIILSSTEVKLGLENKQPIPGHLVCKQENFKMIGSMEPIVSRDWDNTENKGAGRTTAFRGVGFVPGSIMLNNKIANICYDGVLEYLE